MNERKSCSRVFAHSFELLSWEVGPGTGECFKLRGSFAPCQEPSVHDRVVLLSTPLLASAAEGKQIYLDIFRSEFLSLSEAV